MPNEVTPRTPRRMKGNGNLVFHSPEHDWTPTCDIDPRCEPVTPAAPPHPGKEALARECPRCHCLSSGHHGKGTGCEGAGGNCPCDLTAEQAAGNAEVLCEKCGGGQNYASVNRRPLCYCPRAFASEPATSPLTREEPQQPAWYVAEGRMRMKDILAKKAKYSQEEELTREDLQEARMDLYKQYGSRLPEFNGDQHGDTLDLLVEERAHRLRLRKALEATA